MKNKLKLQTKQREAYEEQHSKMMKILNIRGFANIIPAIKSLLEKNETNLYSNAQVIIESSSRGKNYGNHEINIDWNHLQLQIRMWNK